MTSRTLLPAFAALALTACVADPTKDQPKATVETAATMATAMPAMTMAATTGGSTSMAGAETLPIDTTASKLLWTASKVTKTHHGGFKTFKGTITLAAGKPEASKVDVEIDAASLFADAEQLVKHLNSPDFFDTATYPKATFTSTSITPSTAAGSTHTVKGNLTMHGVTKEISFPATIKVDDKHVNANAKFSVNRKDWKIVYTGKADDLIRDDVLIEWDIVAKRG